MKILHVITGLSTGGAERALYNVLSGGLSIRAENAVISLSEEGVYGEPLRALGLPVCALGMRVGLRPLWPMVTLQRVVREWCPDVVHGWMYHGNIMGWLAACSMARGRPAIAWNVRQGLHEIAHNKLMTRQVIRANRLLSPRVDAIVYNAQLSRQQHETFGFATNKACVIPNGFDLERLACSAKRARAARLALRLPVFSIVVGHVARLHPVKDHARFLRAAVRIAATRDDVRFILVGRDVIEDNPVLSGIVPDDLLARFHFLGERPDVADLMGAMDLFCQSSLSEAFPNVLGEAMAAGVPCVATDVGDSARIVGETGIMVVPGNDDALFKGLDAMLAKTSEERVALGGAARARVQARFALGAAVDRYVALYESLNSQRPTER